MRAHHAVCIIVLPQLTQQTRCRSSFSIIFMDHELSDPAHILTFIYPAASECVAGKAAVDGHFGVRASGAVG